MCVLCGTSFCATQLLSMPSTGKQTQLEKQIPTARFVVRAFFGIHGGQHVPEQGLRGVDVLLDLCLPVREESVRVCNHVPPRPHRYEPLWLWTQHSAMLHHVHHTPLETQAPRFVSMVLPHNCRIECQRIIPIVCPTRHNRPGLGPRSFVPCTVVVVCPFTGPLSLRGHFGRRTILRERFCWL